MAVINPEAWYTTASAAEVIPGTSSSALAQLRHRGKGPAYSQHSNRGRVLYQGRDLIAWLESGRIVPGMAA